MPTPLEGNTGTQGGAKRITSNKKLAMGTSVDMSNDATGLFVEACRSRSRASWDRVFGEIERLWSLRSGLKGFLALKLRDAARADDLVQETFLKVYTECASFNGASLRAWIWQIGVNKLTDELRSRKRKSRLFAEFPVRPALQWTDEPGQLDADDFGRSIWTEGMNRPDQEALRQQAVARLMQKIDGLRSIAGGLYYDLLLLLVYEWSDPELHSLLKSMNHDPGEFSAFRTLKWNARRHARRLLAECANELRADPEVGP